MEITQQSEFAVDVATIEKYLLIKDEIENLTKELDDLKVFIMPIVEKAGNKLMFGDRQLILAERRSYEYSETIKGFEDEIKKQKKIEELQGTAKVKSTSKYITVR